MKLRYVLLTLIVMFVYCNVYSIEFDNTLKIYDYGQTLTEKEEIKLKDTINKYIDKYNIDMVMVTVKYYNYSNLTDYIREFYSKNNFGIDDNKSGIIIVLDLKNNKIGIEKFGKANDIYSDGTIKHILSKLDRYNSNYKKLKYFIKYTNDYAYKGYNKIDSKSKSYKIINWIIILVISILIPTMFSIMIKIRIKKIERINDKNYYIDEKSIVINKREEKYITTHTKKVRKK